MKPSAHYPKSLLRLGQWFADTGLPILHPALLKYCVGCVRMQAGRNALRAGFTVVIVFLDYMLMLIVMTFNVGIIVAAVLGFELGALLFGERVALT